MAYSDTRKTEFNDRLKRISKGGPNTLGHVYVGPAEDGADASSLRPHFGIVATVWSFILGAAAYLLGNLAQYHLLSEQGAYSPERLGATGAMVASTTGDLILAGVVAYLLLRLFRMRGFGPTLVGAMGLFAMMGGYSASIEWAPEIFATLYSAEYVAQYVAPDYGSMAYY